MSESRGVGAEVEPFAVNGYEITLRDGYKFKTTSERNAQLYGVLPQQMFPLDGPTPEIKGLTADQVSQHLFRGSASNPAKGWQARDYKNWLEYTITSARRELVQQGYYIYLKDGTYFLREGVDLPVNQTELVAIANAVISHEGVKALISKKAPVGLQVPDEIKNLVVDVTERHQNLDVAEDSLLVPERRKLKMEAYQRARVLAAKKMKWLSENKNRAKVMDQDYPRPDERKLVEWLSDPSHNEQFSGHFYKFLADDPVLAQQLNFDYKNFGIKDTERVWYSGRV